MERIFFSISVDNNYYMQSYGTRGRIKRIIYQLFMPIVYAFIVINAMVVADRPVSGFLFRVELYDSSRQESTR